jgi:transposase
MESYSRAAMERAMKVQEVILRAVAKKITWWQAAEIIGISDRHMRRWRERYEEFGFRGLFDRRRGKPSPKRAPMAVVERVLELYREKYFDLNVRHFHEKLAAEHQIELSYSWVKGVLQGAGLMARGRKRGVHRQRRPRRPLPGMLLHIEGSEHRWFHDERWYDLIVIRDDATSEIYYAQLVEEESTLTVMAALQEVIERKGVFCALYSDRGSHFWLTPKAGEAVDPHRLTQVGRALRELGIRMIRGLFAASARAQRTQLRHLAGTTAAGVAPGRMQQRGTSQSLPARTLHRRVQSPLSGSGGGAGQRLCAVYRPRSGPRFLTPVRAHSKPRQHGQLPESQTADRAGALAWHARRLQRYRPPTPGRQSQPELRTPLLGSLWRRGPAAAGEG